jgi:hypothetical protein
VDDGYYVEDTSDDPPEEVLASIQAHQQQLISQTSVSDEIDDEMERAFDTYAEQVNDEKRQEQHFICNTALTCSSS